MSSYAGAVVDVLEGLDGQMAVRYRGEIIASQEAPSRPGILRSFNGSSSHKSGPRPNLNGLGRRWEAVLAALDAEMDARDADDNGAVRVRGMLQNSTVGPEIAAPRALGYTSVRGKEPPEARLHTME